MPQASRAEKDGLGWTGVKKRRREGDKNGNLFERSEFISVQPDRRSFSPFRRSLDFSFCELYLFIKEKKKWTPTLGERKKSGPPNLWEREKWLNFNTRKRNIKPKLHHPRGPVAALRQMHLPHPLGRRRQQLIGAVHKQHNIGGRLLIPRIL